MVYAAILIGGVLGGCLRYSLSLIPLHSQFPADILGINLAGSLILGSLYAFADVRPVPAWLRHGLGAGVMGAFTTFSTFCFDLDQLMKHSAALAIVFMVGSMAGGPLLAFVGDRLVLWIAGGLRTEEISA